MGEKSRRKKGGEKSRKEQLQERREMANDFVDKKIRAEPGGRE
jgi:hypothetical protein